MSRNLTNQKRAATRILQEQNLVIGNIEYESLAISLHTRWPGHLDPIVNTIGVRKFYTWFAYAENYNMFLDLDVTKRDVCGGFRINSIRELNNPNNIRKTSGDVYKLIVQSIDEKTLSAYSSNRKRVSKDLTPLLYFKNKPQTLTRKIYHLPRYGDFSNLNYDGFDKHKFIFVEKMITNSLDWLIAIDNPPSQLKPIIISLLLKGEEKFILDNGIATKTFLDKYKAFFDEGKSMSLRPKIDKSKALTVKNLCTMFGYFSRDTTFIS